MHRLDNFINQNIPYLFNKEIIEYDMRNAGFSLIKEFKLLPEEKIHFLEKLKKEYRTVEIGKLQRDDETLKKLLKEAFQEIRKEFYEMNQIRQEDILSIKKDAIFTTKKCRYLSFGNYVEFRKKNIYTSYIQLPNKLEFYYNPEKLDVKGIGDSTLEYHKDFLLHFIKTFFHKMETESSEVVLDYTRRFITKYKRRQLPVGYYRTFDYRSCYLVTYDTSLTFTDFWEEEKEDLDIYYNFNRLLIKFIQIPL